MSAYMYPTPKEGWTCFHCGQHFAGSFKGWQEALHHFGEAVLGDAWCQYTARQVRAMEALLRSYQEEDAPRDRHLAKLQAEHAVALRQEEEKGYARGLRDLRPVVEALSELVAEIEESGTRAFELDAAHAALHAEELSNDPNTRSADFCNR